MQTRGAGEIRRRMATRPAGGQPCELLASSCAGRVDAKDILCGVLLEDFKCSESTHVEVLVRMPLSKREMFRVVKMWSNRQLLSIQFDCRGFRNHAPLQPGTFTYHHFETWYVTSILVTLVLYDTVIAIPSNDVDFWPRGPCVSRARAL